MDMKRFAKVAAFAAATVVGLGMGSTVMARGDNRVPQINIGQAQIAPEAEQVESFSMLTRPYSWQMVDDDTVILWATAFKPYLVELAFPSHDLRWAHAIGVTSVGSRVYAKFDAIRVGGFRYPIDAIYQLTREEARNWNRTS
jgi:Family of unknown function (DUF6491)